MKTKAQISCAVTDHAFFTTQIVQFLFFVNPKSQASSLLLWLYRLIWTSFLTSRLIKNLCLKDSYALCSILKNQSLNSVFKNKRILLNYLVISRKSDYVITFENIISLFILLLLSRILLCVHLNNILRHLCPF